MEDFRGEVGTVRPHNRPELCVYSNLREALRILERLEHASDRPVELRSTVLVVYSDLPREQVIDVLSNLEALDLHDPPGEEVAA